MSSIAYVTDEKMLEYHRLCRNRTILFWRLSSKKNFRDFKKGDILFFFAKSRYGRKKGLVGYAHYDSTKRISMRQMWDIYGRSTGYDSEERLRSAIEKASRNNIPDKMNCLLLKDVVFFLSPIYPEDVGLAIPSNLESYCYLDKTDPEITVRILQKADRIGIDLWSSDDEMKPEEIFRKDELLHQFAAMYKNIGPFAGSDREKAQAKKLVKNRTEEKGWDYIRGSRTDCICLEENRIRIGLPYVYQANDRDLRTRELVGRAAMYAAYVRKEKIGRELVIELLSAKDTEEISGLLKEIGL
jgi:hypothetical protein